MKLKKTKSKLFTNAQYDEFQLRLKGKKKNYSIFTNRLKPKLIEIVALEKYMDKIKEILKTGGTTKNDTPELSIN